MTTEKKQIKNEAVNNEVNNNTLSINVFKAAIYQLDKNNNRSFELLIHGTTEDKDESYIKLATILANRTNKILNYQIENVEKYNGKHRLLKMSISKPIFFEFILNGEKVLDSQLFAGVKVCLSSLKDEKHLEFIYNAIIDLIRTCNNIQL